MYWIKTKYQCSALFKKKSTSWFESLKAEKKFICFLLICRYFSVEYQTSHWNYRQKWLESKSVCCSTKQWRFNRRSAHWSVSLHCISPSCLHSSSDCTLSLTSSLSMKQSQFRLILNIFISFFFPFFWTKLAQYFARGRAQNEEQLNE